MWVPLNGQYPDFPSLMNVSQMEIALGSPSKAWLQTSEETPAICGPRSLSLWMPMGLGFPLSHLRKESPSSDSQEKQ